MTGAESVMAVAHDIADAIAARDVDRLAAHLAPDFVHRTAGGPATDRAAFIDAVRSIPGEIEFVRLERLAVDFVGGCAVATGIQHARVRLAGGRVDDRRAFVDVFVRAAEGWRIGSAVDVPDPLPEPARP